MPTVTFDTLDYARKMEKAGFTRDQAEAQAEILKAHTDAQNEAVQKILEERPKELATKADLKADLKDLELRLLKWQIGGWLALAGIMAKGFGWLGF